MLQKLFFHSLPVIILAVILHSRYPCSCTKCELKGMVNNRVQCVLHDRAEVVKRKSADNTKEDSVQWLEDIVRDLDDEIEMQIQKCGKALDCNKAFFKGLLNDFKKHVVQSVPGTRWCTNEDLQNLENAQTLECCTEHYNCENVITTNQTKFGITNHAIFTRSHCDCDKKFYYCLKGVNDIISRQIGYTYFTVLRAPCFKSEHPVTGCIRELLGKCIEYKFDINKQKIYQWFDNPPY